MIRQEIREKLDNFGLRMNRKKLCRFVVFKKKIHDRKIYESKMIDRQIYDRKIYDKKIHDSKKNCLW